MANLFLYLYFKCDEGYFTVGNLEFKYNKGVSVGTSLVRRLRNCHKKTKTLYIIDGPIDKPNTTLANQLQGIWIDLSGEQRTDDEWSVDKISQWSFDELQLNSYSTQLKVLEEIKSSFPCFQGL